MKAENAQQFDRKVIKKLNNVTKSFSVRCKELIFCYQAICNMERASFEILNFCLIFQVNRIDISRQKVTSYNGRL